MMAIIISAVKVISAQAKIARYLAKMRFDIYRLSNATYLCEFGIFLYKLFV